MTKDELIARIEGLPGDTEIVWEDLSDGAHWTFIDVRADVELLARVEVVEEGFADTGDQFWDRLSSVRQYESEYRTRVVRMKPVIVLGEWGGEEE